MAATRGWAARTATSRTQPAWRAPTAVSDAPVLTLFNSLTRSKTPLIPRQPSRLTWYNCGPTVYDAAHMGHARNYVSVDVLRRVLEDYFGYHIHFVMNVTDIDDKIIVRARQDWLLKHWMRPYAGKVITDKILEELRQAVAWFEQNNVIGNDQDAKYPLYVKLVVSFTCSLCM